MAFTGETIWIIGASTGIGEALCRKLADLGATLIISSRRRELLEQLNQELGGGHLVYPLDVADRHAVQQTSQQISTNIRRLDRVIFMAAIYRPQSIQDIQASFAEQLVQVNLLGAIYCSLAVLPILSKQASGQLVLCASSAGYTGLARGQPYSATKAALINFAESLAAEVSDTIDIKVINPGFVKTPMTDQNDFRMPLRIEVEEAADSIIKGLNKKGFEIHFPKRFTYLLKLIGLLPYWLQFWLKRRLTN